MLRIIGVVIFLAAIMKSLLSFCFWSFELLFLRVGFLEEMEIKHAVVLPALRSHLGFGFRHVVKPNSRCMGLSWAAL